MMKKLMMGLVLMPMMALATTWYVNGSSGSDSNSGTSQTSAKKTIQAAINAASNGSKILVAAGTYRENVVWSEKQLELQTIGVLDVTIDGNQSGSCIRLESGAAGSIIDGFILYNGAPINSGNKYGGGICCSATATIKNCVFKNNGNTSQHFSGGLQIGADAVIVYNCLFVNNTVHASGGAVLCEGSGTLNRCTIYGNTCTYWNQIGGIAVASGGAAAIKNSIIWGNSTVSIGSYSGGSRGTYSVTYSCVEGGCSGSGNISSNPSFADTTQCFALNSDSPCINAGEPSSTDPDGSRGDMGFSIALIRRDADDSDNPTSGNTGGSETSGVADAPQIRNVKAFQQYPCGEAVYISYEVVGNIADSAGEGRTPTLLVTAKNKTTGREYAAVPSSDYRLTGDTGAEAGNHRVVWDIGAQGVTINSDNVVFSVAYVDTLYMVVDLSSGANSSSYPVSYLDAVPSGGWTDEYRTNKLVMRLIEKGSCRGSGEDETLATKITSPFYIGIFEVTQKQFELVMGDNPSRYKGDMRPVEKVSLDRISGTDVWGLRSWFRGESQYEVTLYPGCERIAVADSFNGRLQERTGLNFNLPREAQWEYACRADTRSNYNNGGDAEDDLKLLGRYKGNQTDGNGGCSEHTKVGSYLPNAWGLYDMHGNVAEWCLDGEAGCLNDSTDVQGYPYSHYSDYTYYMRYVHGGSYDDLASDCVSSSRGEVHYATFKAYYYTYPGANGYDLKCGFSFASHASVGFRLAITLP